MSSIASSNSIKSNTAPPMAALWYWDVLALSLLGIGFFFFLTNGIPLAQLGPVDGTFSKKVCVRMARCALLVVFPTFLLWAWRWPDLFHRLAIIRLLKKIVEAPLTLVLSTLFILYGAIHSTVGFMRHWAIETRAYDLGIFTQAVWNTLQGDLLYSSIKGGICLLGDHVSPILVALAPFYVIWPDPKNLLLIQALAAGLSLFPIGYLARQKTKQPWVAICFALAYFFYAPTRSALHDDFHPEVLGEPFLFAAFLCLESRRLTLMLLSLVLAISSKENMLGISFMLGVYAFAWKGERRLGIFLMLASVGLLLLDVLWVVPYFGKGSYLYRGSYDGLASNPFLGILQRLLNWEAFEYVLKVYAPFLFLPFLHFPTLCLTFPVLFQNLLSENPFMRSFGFHYTIGMTPFLFIASLYGFCILREKIRWVSRHEISFAMIFLFVALLRSGPSEYYFFSDSLSHKTPHRDFVRMKLKEISPDVSVLTHNRLIPQLINRKEIYQFSHSDTPSKAEWARKYGAEYVILEQEFWEPETRPLAASLGDLQAAGYIIEFEKDGFVILRK